MSKNRTKRISKTGVLGQEGVNLIERVVLEMGSRWTPSGPNETGIDGYIEFYDPVDQKAFGITVAVQSKAVTEFENNSASGFHYRCDRRDIDYWLISNVPVILIVSRPSSSEAYWISVKDYFKTSPSATRVEFNKTAHTFTRGALPQLLEVAEPKASGLNLPPSPQAETLYSNILPLDRYPDMIFFAPTECKRPLEVWGKLRNASTDVSGSWLLHKKQIYSFHDLRNEPWTSICDAGATEEFETAEWAKSYDMDYRRSFVRLLNLTLKEQLRPEVRYWPREDCYAYTGKPTGNRKSKKVAYRSLKRRSEISVVTKYTQTTKERQFAWYRHMAFRGQFRRFEDDWFLEITPSYRFTRDGENLYRFHENNLKRIKQKEGNRAVLSSVLFWVSFLRPSRDLLARRPPLLQFGELASFDLDVGLNDAAWESSDPNTRITDEDTDQLDLGLTDAD